MPQPGPSSDLYPLQTFIHELGRVKDDARLLVLVASGVIELFVNTIIEAKCKNGHKITSDSRGYPHSARLIILNEIGALNDQQFRLYDWLRKLRNRAAHDPIFSLTKNDLAHFKAKYQDKAQFHRVCRILVAGLWNSNVPVLLPRFMPGWKAFYEQSPSRQVSSAKGPAPPEAQLLSQK